MNHIEQKALETYKKNLDYFQQAQPKLFQKLQTLDIAIQEGVYKERYSLEYLSEGYFDVQSLEDASWLYGTNSKNYSKELTKIVDKKKTGGVLEAQRHVDYSPNMPDIIDQSQLSFHNALWATIKIIDYSKKNAPKHSTTMKQVYKTIFLGVGLGLHIQDIIEKLGSKIVFIKENNLELFRLTLFVVDYTKIIKDRICYFSVMEDSDELKETYLQFLEKGNNYNLYIKYIPFLENYEADLDVFQNFMITQDHIYYPYSAYLLRYIDGPKYLTQGFSILNINTRYPNSYFSSKPVLLIFSGPSTGKNIEWIKEHQHKFILICALSTCKLLYMNDIKPDIVFHIDPSKEDALKTLEGIEHNFFKDITFIFSSNLHEDIMNIFSHNTKFIIQQGVEYKKNHGQFGAPTVGEFTYGISLILGTKDLYLVGIDLALDADTLSSHSEYHPYKEQGSLTQKDETRVDRNTLFVKGNFRTTVPTFSSFIISIKEFARFSAHLKEKTQHVYNLSDGAFLEGADPLYIQDVPTETLNTIPKKEKKEKINAFLHSISSCAFTEEDKEVLRYQINEAKQLLKKIKIHKKKIYVIPALYGDALAKLSWDLSDMENKTHSDLSHVYYYFFKVVLSYIFDLLNTTELENIKNHINNIDDILVYQLEKMGNLYIKRMEEYTKNEVE